jgi:methionyl-tRNA formyltransferase
LLPQYRGAAPINWAIINGEKQTGVTTFKLQHEIDTGNILLQEKIDIADDETAGSLHDTMMNVGAELLLKTINQLEAGTLQEIAQSHSSLTSHPLTLSPSHSLTSHPLTLSPSHSLTLSPPNNSLTSSLIQTVIILRK